jgi:hypothetical protein
MPKEKTLEEKLEEASSAVERALEARDKAIQDLMEAKMAYGKVWRKLHDKSQARVPDEKDEKTALRKASVPKRSRRRMEPILHWRKSKADA